MKTHKYDQRFERVCEFINANLDDSPSLEDLSELACLSKFHFHRLFTAIKGLSLTKYIQLARLRRASFRLAFESDKRVIEIALEAQFDSPEAFSRAFKREFNQTPSEFRKAPLWPQWHERFEFKKKEKGTSIMNIDIVDFKTTRVALLAHLGAPEKVFETASKYIAWRKQSGLSPVKTSRTFGIPHSDPNTTDPKYFHWDVCGSVVAPVPDNDFGVINSEIPGGRCAVVRHKGSHTTMDETIYRMYRDWLPESDEEVRDHPIYFDYLNFVHEVDECDLLTDIYLPIK